MTGSGTLADPYVIWDITDLQNINLDLTAYYELGQNINAMATSTWNQLTDRGAWAPFTAYFVNDFVTNAGKKYYCIKAHTSGALFAVSDKWMQTRRLNPGDFLGFRMLGTFTGSLDGKNHQISGVVMNIEIYSSARLALFHTNDGTISNFNLVNSSITASSVDFNAGISSLVYYNAGTIENCHVSGTLLVTCYLPSTFAYCWAAGFAQFNDGTIDNCSSSCTVTAIGDDGAEADGFISENYGTIRGSYGTGNVMAQASGASEANAQGFMFLNYGYTVGTTYTALVSDCYTRVNATAISAIGPEHVSGFADENSNDGSTTSQILNSYSTGLLTGKTKNGLCRVNGGDITECFWDIETSGTMVSNGGTGKTTTEMKTLATFADAGWDIEGNESADLADGYPFLSWQIPGSSPIWYIFIPGVPVPPSISVVTLPATEIR
jgi:hypothetical protein